MLTRDDAQRLEFYYMINYYFKYIELIDTVFLALKKKPLGAPDASSSRCPRSSPVVPVQHSCMFSTTLQPRSYATLS